MTEERLKVVENIKIAIEEKDFHRKVELYDPVLTREEKDAIVRNFTKKRHTLSYKIKSSVARLIANTATSVIGKNTEIVGLDNAVSVKSGAIITSNHFSPTENTAVRKLSRMLGKKRLNVVSEETNFAMNGLIGFLMNYADTIPITDNIHYMQRDFTPLLKKLFDRGEHVLIYPEREMWSNYRKPRPVMDGAYYFAAKLSVPIIPCFVEIKDTEKGVSHTLHVLTPLYPDENKSVRENTRKLAQLDYEAKKNAYEKIYGKALDYTFDEADIGGLK